ncbi:TIGR03364 family FAD-dependent oxidoreductase [Sphingobium sp. EM0848]|uniref:TIGR03364 family FAD-dependent oxidoreductase n=1 Tax=Sphingobium sp. EM0848 TaxID=2743473 RepID=UPI001C3F8CDD|nr:TIGR03364 family FAD-dependent oxidoreductase [Sphingobium sp. EM0848]
MSFDIAVIGAGIVGLAHALAAARHGKRVVVIDRDAQANGASVRNFGFVTVTGQEAGQVWRRARRSRDIWAEIAGPAGIVIEQRGLVLVARRPEARAVAEAFLATDMGEGCRWIDAGAVRRDFAPQATAIEGALVSDIDLRVESRTAIPALARWLAEAMGVTFLRQTAVYGVETGLLATSAGTIRADAILVCTGDDLTGLFPRAHADAGVTRCKLQMLRLANPGYRLPAAVMSDLGMVRYLGYSALPEAAALRVRLEAEQAAHLAHGVHLIVTQSADGSLVVGDSHHYAATPDPFSLEEVDRLILDEFGQVFGHTPPAVIERWTGTYASGPGHSLIAEPLRGVTLVTVTSGTGASTGFGLAEEVMGRILGIAMGEEA